MPTITGFWKDLGLAPVNLAQAPRLIFRLSSPALAPDGTLHFTDPVYATPVSDGSFTVPLTLTDELRPTDQSIDRIWINVWAEWLEDSADPDSGFSTLAGELRVTGDGTIAEMLDVPVITGQYIVRRVDELPLVGRGVLIIDTFGAVPHLSITA